MVEQSDEPIDFGILLGLAYQSFADRLRASLAKQGFDDLGGAYGYVFRALSADRLSQRELAVRLGVNAKAISHVANGLEARDLAWPPHTSWRS